MRRATKQRAIQCFFDKPHEGIQIYASEKDGFRWYLSTHDNLNMFQYGQLKIRGQEQGSNIRVGDWKEYWSSGQINVDSSYTKQGKALRRRMWDPNGRLMSRA